MTYTALLAIAPVLTVERINDPSWRPDRVMFGAGALTLLPSETSVPLLVGHNPDRVIGNVDTILRHEQADGPWVCCIAEVHHCPVWMKRQDTKVSFGYKPGHTNTDFLGGHEVVHRGYIVEVSVLPPGCEPADPLARVLTLHPTETKPAAVEEIIHTPPAQLVHRARTDPDNDELDELRRRMDFCPDAPMELIIKNMTIEMQLGRRSRRVA